MPSTTTRLTSHSVGKRAEYSRQAETRGGALAYQCGARVILVNVVPMKPITLVTAIAILLTAVGGLGRADESGKPKMNRNTRIFDAGKGYEPVSKLLTIVDSTVVKRGDRWWMFAGGVDKTSWEIQLFSASLPAGAPLSATGWQITTDASDPSKPQLLAGKAKSHWWDGKGGRHCPSYVRGFDPDRNAWVERIYYAGAATDYMGPYSIGYVEWDGEKWQDQSAPVFTANEYWEHGSVYEPNLIYHDGKWKMWYVAGANQDDYLVQGYAESPNGRNDWSPHQVFLPQEEKVFDFCVLQTEAGYEAVFSRVDLSGKGAVSKAGLWWCRAKTPSSKFTDWSEPVRVAESGPWKPCLRYGEASAKTMFIFCDGAYPNTSGAGIPLHFTIDCLEADRPH